MSTDNTGGWPGRFHTAALNYQHSPPDTAQLDELESPGPHPMEGHEAFTLDGVFHLYPENAHAKEIAEGAFIQIDDDQVFDLGDLR